MKGRPLVETPSNGEAVGEEDDEFIGFQRHGLAVGRQTSGVVPVLGTSPTAPVRHDHMRNFNFITPIWPNVV